MPSEGGHADFAARTDREIELVRMLRELYGRAEVEHVLSGPGLLNLHRFTHGGGECEASQALDADRRARAASRRRRSPARCPACAEALRCSSSAYGAEAGNLALRGVATVRRVRRRRHRAEDPAGAAGRAVHRGVSRQGRDGGACGDDPGQGDPDAGAGLLGAAVAAQELL